MDKVNESEYETYIKSTCIVEACQMQRLLTGWIMGE